jgi:hypothetical protein
MAVEGASAEVRDYIASSGVQDKFKTAKEGGFAVSFSSSKFTRHKGHACQTALS